MPEHSTPPKFGECGLDAALIDRLVLAVNARIDSADRRLLVLLRILYTTDLPDPLAYRARQAVTSFRYSAAEPGDDAMVFWNESNLLCFAVAEYLAGQLFASHTFLNDGRSGRRHRINGEERLNTWLADRFRFGFSEWLSPDQLADDVCALALLIDHAEDEALVTRASMILDLILLDACLLSFEGRLMTAAARVDEGVATDPSESTMTCVLASALDKANSHEMSADNLCAIFSTRQRYQVPAVIKAIGLDERHRRVEISQGVDVLEIPRALQDHPDYPRWNRQDRARFNWSMRAFSDPENLELTLATMRNYRLGNHPELSALKLFKAAPDRTLPALSATLQPVLSGRALQRGNVQSFRTPQYQLSSAQRYHPGEFGDQHHLWHARLVGGVEVFGNHPGSGSLKNVAASSTPAQWVGNGVNPDIAQDGNVLLAISNLHRRRGLGEPARQDFVHFYFPFVDFTQTKIGSNWVAGRSGDGFIGIVGTGHLDQISETEVVQRGKLSGYCVLMGDDEEFGSLGAFVQQLRELRLRLDGQTLRLTAPFAEYSLTWRGDFLVDGTKRSEHYPRYASPAVNSGRNPRKLVINHDDQRLTLDWAAGERSFS